MSVTHPSNVPDAPHIPALQAQSYHTNVLKILCKMSQKYQSKHWENIKVSGLRNVLMILNDGDGDVISMYLKMLRKPYWDRLNYCGI